MVSGSSRSPSSSVRSFTHRAFAKLVSFSGIFAEDELVSLDDLQEKVAEFEDYVQSSDIAAMQSECQHCLRYHECRLNKIPPEL